MWTVCLEVVLLDDNQDGQMIAGPSMERDAPIWDSDSLADYNVHGRRGGPIVGVTGRLISLDDYRICVLDGGV